MVSTPIDASQQRSRLRTKMSSEKSKLQSLLEKYNCLMLSSGKDPLSMEDVIVGIFLDDVAQSGGNWLVIRLCLIAIIYACPC